MRNDVEREIRRVRAERNRLEDVPSQISAEKEREGKRKLLDGHEERLESARRKVERKIRALSGEDGPVSGLDTQALGLACI